jgi:3-hydroxybutyryl-CoA dehydrogenase
VTKRLAESFGKTPVEVADFPGFVSNRVLMPMINEAIFCVMEGVGSPEAIDTVMKLGMNHPLGPLALADLIGLDICLNILEVLQEAWGTRNIARAPSCGRWLTRANWAENPVGDSTNTDWTSPDRQTGKLLLYDPLPKLHDTKSIES